MWVSNMGIIMLNNKVLVNQDNAAMHTKHFESPTKGSIVKIVMSNNKILMDGNQIIIHKPQLLPKEVIK